MSAVSKTKVRSFDEKAAALAFPLGGVGTGTVSLGARGDLRDWEIFNRPAKGVTLNNTYFALRVKPEGGKPVAKVLQAALQPPLDHSHGFDPQTGAGLPRFTSTTFYGEYPFARIDFHDDALPVRVSLEAFTPLIPLDPEKSGIPCAIFTYSVTNTGAVPLDVTIAGSLFNPVGHESFDPTNQNRRQQLGKTINRRRDDQGVHGVFMTAEGIAPDALEYGSLALATDAENTTIKPAFLRAGWWDWLREYWTDLLEDGRLNDLGYDTPADYPDSGAVGAYATLAPGASTSMRFVLAWHFPNRNNSWDLGNATRIRNHYATIFTDAWAAAAYTLREQALLEAETRKFHAALFDSTLPAEVIDALSANIVPMRSNTSFWLEDGRFMAWEGCFDNAGCCHGTCTHVWSYAYTAAYLFPSLEREMRRIELNVETETDGYMAFRTERTFNPDKVWMMSGERRAAVDGQMGTILRTYREWQLSGDIDWLRSVWQNAKLALNFAGIQWDTDHDTLLDGKQHNTYDINFYGVNPLCNIYYLAALRAGAALARVMGETDFADKCDAVFATSSRLTDEQLWNGEYYIQRLEDVDAYPYQHGLGCLSDQLLGQAHAEFLGLGDLLPREHVTAALQSIYKYNFRRDFTDHINMQRTFVLNDESGLILCTWPYGGEPRFPFPYSDEVWTGIEYHVAAHLIALGSVETGLALVQAVRDRHDGQRRSPWNEVECGHHYARSMASWMLLLALTGFRVDPLQREMRFAPIETDKAFKFFWSNGQAWGSLVWDGAAYTVDTCGGSLDG
ncbi:MAG: hypothetical protein JNJ61_12490, partial [Anaerolineae bacterium]|nr:hypothetical protein [Anaerolineae bacterium]